MDGLQEPGTRRLPRWRAVLEPKWLRSHDLAATGEKNIHAGIFLTMPHASGLSLMQGQKHSPLFMFITDPVRILPPGTLPGT